MKRLPLLSRLSAPLVVLLSLLMGSCGPSPEQQATLVAVSVNATLTSEAARIPPAPPTIPAPPPVQPTIAQASAAPLPTELVTQLAAPNQSGQGYADATNEANWKRSLYDPFTKNLFGWCDSQAPDTGSDGSTAQFFLKDGTYHAILKSGDKGTARWCAPYGTYYDFNASVLTKLIDTDDENSSYGLVFRAFQQSYMGVMSFYLNPKGQYYVSAVDNHGNIQNIQELTNASGLSTTGDWNKLTVSAEGSNFTFFINDVYQTSITYESNSTAKGSIGVGVDLSQPRRSIEAEFDEYDIRVP